MAGLNEEVTISFLLVGHTKFAPDQGFGLFKRVFKRTRVGTIYDIADVVRQSAVLNHPQLIGDYDGNTFVKFYDWSQMFEEYTTAIKGISKFQHFRVSSTDPGVVFVRTASDGEESKINILRDHSWKPSPSAMPPPLIPPGLPLERQWYLNTKIREFCPDEAKDIVCPLPTQQL